MSSVGGVIGGFIAFEKWEVLETYFKTDFRYFAPSFPYQLTGGFEDGAVSAIPVESVLHFLKSRLNVDRLQPV